MKFLSISWNVQSRGQNRATKKPGTKTRFKGSHGLTAQCRFIRKIVQAHHCAVRESFSHANGCEASVGPNLQNTSSHKARLVSNLITDLEIANYPLKIFSPNTSPPQVKKSNSLVASINHQCLAVPETQLHKEIEPVEYDLFTEQRVACKALMKLFRSCSVKGLLSIWGKRNWSLVSLQTCSRIGLSGDEFATPSESVLQAHDFLTHLIWFAN